MARLFSSLTVSMTLAFASLCFAVPDDYQSSIQPVPTAMCDEMKAQHVLLDQNPVQCGRLRVLNFAFLDFQGKTHNNGQIMVMDAVARHVDAAFRDLYQQRFPLSKANLITHYKGSDDESMDDNNTSSFNGRLITGGTRLSIHAYGLAIDVNPVQNPFVYFPEDQPGVAIYKPAKGVEYANRREVRLNKDKRQGMAESIIDVFASHGFIYWGGYWDTPIDYQHFQVSREMAELMAEMTRSEAEAFFDEYVRWVQDYQKKCPPVDQSREIFDYVSYLKAELNFDRGETLSDFYRENPANLLKQIQKGFVSEDISCPAD